MTPEQIKKAEKRTREWIQSKKAKTKKMKKKDKKKMIQEVLSSYRKEKLSRSF